MARRGAGRITGKFTAMGALLLALGACAGAPPATYDLSAARDGLARSRSRTLVVVGEPQALSVLDSNRIVITTSDGALNYLPAGQWADRLPKLMQARLIQSFENAQRIAAVGRPGDRLVPAVQLNSDIRRFGIEERSGEAVIEMSVKIVDDHTGKIRAGEVFSARVPAPNGTSAAGASAALDLAAQALMRDVVAWVSRRV
jgi:cholesterol transport system auxiliary component